MKNPEMLLSSLGNKRKNLGLNDGDNLSLFSSINGFHGARNPKPHVQPEVVEVATTEIPDSLPVNTTTDWQAAFGFGQTQNNSSTNNKDWLDDDLGFDPLEESSRGLADLLEKESSSRVTPGMTPFSRMPTFMHPQHRSHNSLGHNLPPGFSHTFSQPALLASLQSRGSVRQSQTEVLSSRMMGLMNSPLHNNHYPESMFTDLLHNKEQTQYNTNQQQNDVFNVKDWQDGLRALLPNINISFGSPQNDTRTNSHHNMTQKNHTNWSSTAHRTEPTSGMPYDPAILTSGNISDGSSLQEGHWLKSINHLTDMDSNNHRLPFVQQLPVRNTVWPPQTHNPRRGSSHTSGHPYRPQIHTSLQKDCSKQMTSIKLKFE